MLAILAEARGDQAVLAFHRTIPDGVLRIAISVIAMGATIVLTAVGVLLVLLPLVQGRDWGWPTWGWALLGAGVLVVARHDRRRAEALARRAGFSLDWD